MTEPFTPSGSIRRTDLQRVFRVGEQIRAESRLVRLKSSLTTAQSEALRADSRARRTA